MLTNPPPDPATGRHPPTPADDPLEARARLRRQTQRNLVIAFALGTAGLVAVGCSIAIRRDLSTVPVGQVGFDDLCGLQDYFDALEIHTTPPPRVVSALDLEGTPKAGEKIGRGGRERFAFDSDFLLKHLRRVLNQNWRRLPDEVQTASAIEIEVKWSEKAGTKRVVTDEEAEISTGPQSWGLPYHVCLSELLYGEPLYRQRRSVWGLPIPGQPQKPSSVAPTAGAAADAGVRDTGAQKVDGAASRRD